MRYIYLGDKLTAAQFRGAACDPVLDERGKCIIGRKPRNQLVRFADGTKCVVLARRLRVRKPATISERIIEECRERALKQSDPGFRCTSEREVRRMVNELSDRELWQLMWELPGRFNDCRDREMLVRAVASKLFDRLAEVATGGG